MKIAYITAHTPFGKGETFVLEEMLALAELGVELFIVPRNPPKEVFHDHGRQLLDRTVWLPLFNGQIFLAFLKAAVLKPCLWKVLVDIFRHSRTLKILLKNLAVVPKAVFIADLLRQEKVQHIHAHWGSTTATMSWVASELTGIPWSMTLHRWDIAEDNLLRLKVERASFVRCTSEDGRHEVLNIVGMEYLDKIKIIPQGAQIPKRIFPKPFINQSEFVITCPANLVVKKGHQFLIKACALLVKKGFHHFKCLIIGSGPLEADLRKQVTQLGVEGFVVFTGPLPHERILQMYERREVDAVVLPSIVTADGEREGSPAALREAMAFGIPVISTKTGGIPELLRDGAGILVTPGSAEELAEALAQIITNEQLRKEIGEKGRQRILKEFNWSVFAEAFLKLVNQSLQGT